MGGAEGDLGRRRGAFWVADHDLHDRLMRAGGNQRAAAVIDRLRATTALLGSPTTTAGRTLSEICAEHEPIVTAILRRDGAGAERAMRRHLEHTGRLLARTLHRAPVEAPPGPRGVSRNAPNRGPTAGWGSLRTHTIISSAFRPTDREVL